MKEMFGKNADLSIISNSKEPLHMSHVVHKATIEINEKLTEDTAASGEILTYNKIHIINILLALFILCLRFKCDTLKVQIFIFQGSTSITLGGTGSFLAEHPFMYFVWDRETKTTIFSGSIKHFD